MDQDLELGEIDILDCLHWLENTEGFAYVDEVITLISFVKRHLISDDRQNALFEAAAIADENAKCFMDRARKEDGKGFYTEGGRWDFKSRGASAVRDDILKLKDRK